MSWKERLRRAGSKAKVAVKSEYARQQAKGKVKRIRRQSEERTYKEAYRKEKEKQMRAKARRDARARYGKKSSGGGGGNYWENVQIALGEKAPSKASKKRKKKRKTRTTRKSKGKKKPYKTVVYYR